MTLPLSSLATTAVRSLRAKLQRTLLALFGIAVGIGSVTALITTGSIARHEAVKQFESLGTDILSLYGFSISRQGTSARDQLGLTRDNVVTLPNLPTISDIAPFVVLSGSLQESFDQRRIQIVGATENIQEMVNLRLDTGRFLSPLDGTRPFAVVGSNISSRLDSMGRDGGVGGRFKVRDSVYTIIGTLRPAQRGPSSIRPNDTVFVPLGHALRQIGTKELTGAMMRMVPDAHYLTATSEVTYRLGQIAPHLEVRIDSPVEIIEQIDAQMRLLAILLGTVGGISLIVGGFGVMNAMLASVSEQRLEIGIRRALGARRMDIQKQVLVESSILCLSGGVIGFILGVCITILVSVLAGWDWQFSWGSLVLGVLTAVAVGLFFGYYPARQASRLDPIVALRMV